MIVGVLILKGAAIKIGRLDSPRLNHETGEVVILSQRWFLISLWVATHFSLQVSVHSPSLRLKTNYVVPGTEGQLVVYARGRFFQHRYS